MVDRNHDMHACNGNGAPKGSKGQGMQEEVRTFIRTPENLAFALCEIATKNSRGYLCRYGERSNREDFSIQATSPL